LKFRTQIIISVITISSIINLFLCFYFVDKIRESELNTLNDQIKKSIYMMKLVNAIPVYNVDRETIRMNMETFFEDCNMKSISFKEYDIDIHLYRTFENPKGKDIGRSFFIFHKGLKLGQVNVVYSTSLIEDKLDAFKTQILGFTFIGIVVLCSLLILTINRLTRPVSELTVAASEIASGNLDRTIASNVSGEIGELSRNFALMRDAIKEKINALALTNKDLETQIRLKEINEKKILKQSQVITSVNHFFQKTMKVETYEEIAHIFLFTILKVIPGQYCFIGEFQKDSASRMDLLAISDQILKDCSISGIDQVILSRDQEIAGIRKTVVQEKKTIVASASDSHDEFRNFPENRLMIDSLLAIPMKLGSEVLGMIIIARKQGEYDADDINAGETLATALVEALCLKKRDMEKKELEEMMVHSEKMVSIGGLAAGMAHEINNPLAGILQNTQVILGRLRDRLPVNLKTAQELGLDFDTLQAYMEKRSVYRLMDLVLDAGRRAADIVSNMLSFSRKSNSGFLPEDICDLMDKTLMLAESDYSFKKKFDFKLIKIKKEYEPDIPGVVCKPSEIQQVFLNLLSNGAQAMLSMPDGHSPCFELKIFQEDNMVCIEIKDNGPGMNEEVKKRVFEPFFTTKHVGEGTGLGLSVSYFIIVENHKGSISVSSKPGGGTAFTIKLPLL